MLLNAGLTVQLVSLAESIAVAGNFQRSREDVVDVAEWRLLE